MTQPTYQDVLERSLAAAVSAGLVSLAQRGLLLAHLPRSYVATLATQPSPLAQFRSDLWTLLRLESLAGCDGPPADGWLRAAASLCPGRVEAAVFNELAQALRDGAVGSGVTVLHNLTPARRPFVGRMQLVADLRGALSQSGARVVVHGMGGLGKTALASHLAHGFTQQPSPFQAVAWANGKTPGEPGVERLFSTLVQVLGRADLSALPSERRLTDFPRDVPTLLVIDDLVDDLTLLGFVESLPVTVLATSHVPLAIAARQVPLGELPAADVEALIRTRHEGLDPEAHARISAHAEGVPLAVELAVDVEASSPALPGMDTPVPGAASIRPMYEFIRKTGGEPLDALLRALRQFRDSAPIWMLERMLGGPLAQERMDVPLIEVRGARIALSPTIRALVEADWPHHQPTVRAFVDAHLAFVAEHFEAGYWAPLNRIAAFPQVEPELDGLLEVVAVTNRREALVTAANAAVHVLGESARYSERISLGLAVKSAAAGLPAGHPAHVDAAWHQVDGMAWAERNLGHLTNARDSLTAGRSAAQSIGAQAVVDFADGRAAELDFLAGNVAGARAKLDAVIAGAAARGSHRAHMSALLLRSHVSRADGAMDHALELLAAYIDLAQRLDFVPARYAARGHVERGLVLLELNELDAARAAFQAADAMDVAAQDGRTRAYAALGLGRIELAEAQHKLAEAWARVESSLRAFERLGDHRGAKLAAAALKG